MFGESLYRCFSGFRRPPYPTAPLPAVPASPSSSCPPSPVLFKHFNSLYDPASDSETTTTTLTLTLASPAAAGGAVGASSFSSSCNAVPDDDEDCGGGSRLSEQDLSSAIASRRLLPASPGRSNSIVDSGAVVAVGVGAGVALPTYSPDPYRDFRRSMEEMVAALDLDDGDSRAHLLELLLCYLALNRRHAHKYIMSAFTDLLRSRASAPADVDDGRS